MLRASSLLEIQLLFGRLFSTSVRYTPPPGYNSLHTTRAVFITFCAAKNSLFPTTTSKKTQLHHQKLHIHLHDDFPRALHAVASCRAHHSGCFMSSDCK